MSLNCNEINAILSELDLEGAFIQDIIQPGYDTLALCTYKNGRALTLFICTAHASCRIHETKRKITRNDKPLRFMEFLKSHIKGSRITFCVQVGFERIIKMTLTHADENFIMYIRLWSGAANIVLCTESNIILDTMYRRPAKGEIAGGTFALPEGERASLQKEHPIRTFGDVEERYAREHPDAAPLSFNEKVDMWYGEHARSLSRAALLAQAEKWYAAQKSKKEGALERLKAKRESFKNSGQYKHQGDLILSFGYLIDGKSEFLECDDYDTERRVRIKIDPKKNAQENAAAYYERYRKETRGAEQLIHDIEIEEKEIAALDKRYGDIVREQNPVKIEQLLRRNTKPEQQKKKTHPGLDYTVDGWYIIAGRDANENDELLRRHVRGEDMWLHARDFPGGYVFIKNRPGKTVPRDVLLDAANLAVYYSKGRKAGKADVYYTKVKYLRRAKNGPKGLVLPTQEKNIFVALDQRRLDRLDDIRRELSHE